MVIRDIEPKMVEFLDGKLSGNGLAQHAKEIGDARLVFTLAMEACVGIREVGGNNSGPMVELIQETVGRHSREAWCMALVQTCLSYAEKQTGKKSPIIATEHCLTAWETTPHEQRVKHIPARGAIIIWRHGDSTNGHTGIVLDYHNQPGKMLTVEGNTEKGIVGGHIERDGGGVYLVERDAIGSYDMRIMGYLKPF